MKNNFKYGFSLAEAMIMLTIVSIIMAVSVPLIAKKAQVDTRTLLAHSTYSKQQSTDYTSSTSGGFGNSNAFGIGIKKAYAKLHVRKLNADDGDVVFRVDKADDNNNNNYYGFKVYGDGSTNVRACVPDYTNSILIYGKSGETNIEFDIDDIVDNDGNIKKDGYVLISDGAFSINNNQYSANYMVTTISTTSLVLTRMGGTIVPVSTDNTIQNTTLTLSSSQTISYKDTSGNTITVVPTATFIPCAVTPIK